MSGKTKRPTPAQIEVLRKMADGAKIHEYWGYGLRTHSSLVKDGKELRKLDNRLVARFYLEGTTELHDVAFAPLARSVYYRLTALGRAALSEPTP